MQRVHFFRWARAARDTTPGRNLATKALGYALDQETELRRVLDDGDLPLDNTRAERALRKVVGPAQSSTAVIPVSLIGRLGTNSP